MSATLDEDIKRTNNSNIFFFNDTATTEIYTLSLHDALPIYRAGLRPGAGRALGQLHPGLCQDRPGARLRRHRSEEHTSELQSQSNLVCRLLLEKKNSRHDRRIRCRMKTKRTGR